MAGKFIALALMSLLLLSVAPASASDVPHAEEEAADSGQLGSFPMWSKVEITMTGPSSVGMSESPNPFLIEVDVTFTGPGGTFVVPGYYDGDGSGGMNGNVWRARFMPNAAGAWSYTSSSSESTLNGESDTFTVTSPTGCSAYVPGGMPDFSCVGMLGHQNGDHFLSFDDGTYWLKGGEDEPEAWLATPINGSCGTACGFGSKDAAMTYLASKGVNSMYFITMNILGDGRNVWPYPGGDQDAAQDNHEHIDLSKMLLWEGYFDHMQDEGIVLHFVLEDDSGWSGFNRNLYYREMIARFGHYPGMYFNLAEEYNENYSVGQIESFANLWKSIDPYDHPLTVHNEGGTHARWDAFVGNTNFALTSFQNNNPPLNSEAAGWFSQVESSGHTIAISYDETSALGVGERTLARNITWQIYTAGSNFEILTQPVSDFQDFDDFFEDMTRARGIMESLPFWNMRPRNDLISGGTAYLFAQTGEAYLAYLPAGGTRNINFSGNSNTFNGYWFNTRDGSTQVISPFVGGSTEMFTAPDGNDWALVIEKSAGGGNVAPTANNQGPTDITFETPTALVLSFSDPDGPGPNVFTIDDPPDHGMITGGTSQNRTYTPDDDYDGPDSFTWHVNDGEDNSNVATFSLNVLPEVIVNTPPVADSDSYIVEQDSTCTQLDCSEFPENYIQLVLTDPDGPGPFTITIVNDVDHGTLDGANNDRYYTPDPGYNGPDFFTWKVNDGLDDSNTATITITVDAAPNTAPTAQNDSVSTAEDTEVEITLTATDPEECELAFFNIVDPPDHGDLDTPVNQTCVAGSPNTDTATVNYTPDPGYFGPDSFTWQTNDGQVNSNVATISITVSSEDITFLLSIQEGGAGGWTIPFEVIFFTPVSGPYTGSDTQMEDAVSTGDENGIFVVSTAAGTYDIWAKGDTTLAVLETNVDLTDEPPDPVDLGLQAGGDFTNDNVVNGDDYIPLLLSFGQSTPSLSAPDQLNDHNQNGAVDILDFRIIISNYNSTGVAEPACCS